jgi:diguanylate cyclase (GGDEF)-like protein
MVHPEDLHKIENEIQAQTMFGEKRHDYVRYQIRTKQGKIRYVEDFGHLLHGKNGQSFFYVFIVTLSQEEYQTMRQPEWFKNTGRWNVEKRDALTGLLYEKDFYTKCKDFLSQVQTNWLLLAIDIQNFKLFNEWYGRDTGDDVLSAIGNELTAIAEAHDGVAGYFGSDDYALLVPAGHFDADVLYERVRSTIAARGASVGFLPAIGASYSQGNSSAYSLYDQASLACQEAKGDHKTRVKFFSQAMVSKAEEDYRVLSGFKQALANDEITFFL